MTPKFKCMLRGHIWEYDGYEVNILGRKDRYICRTCKCVKYDK